MVALICILLAQAKLDPKVEQEFARAQAAVAVETPSELLAAADSCLTSSRKHLRAAEAFRDLALVALGKAWTSGTPADQEKVRKKVQLYWGNQAPGKLIPPPAGWADLSPLRLKGCGRDVSYAKTGLFSFKVAAGCSPYLSTKISVREASKVELSAWVLTDGTDGVDQLRVRFFREGGDGITHDGPTLPKAVPVWVKISLEIKVPEGAAEIDINLFGTSKSGSIWIDDVSVLLDSREILQNGSFEKR